MDLIAPMAGRSSRYPGQVPKYLWHVEHGVPMYYHTLNAWVKETDRLCIGLLEEHEKAFNVSSQMREYWPHAEFVFFPEVLDGPALTVDGILTHSALHGPFIVRDVDAAFRPDSWRDMFSPNRIAVTQIGEHTLDPYAKSYPVQQYIDCITEIVEKPDELPGDVFCCGGWTFERPWQFYNALFHCKKNGEYFLSDIVNACIEDGWEASFCTNYRDWGTYQTWQQERKK